MCGPDANCWCGRRRDAGSGREWLWIGGGVPYGPLKGFGYEPRTRLWRTLASGPSVINDAMLSNGNELIVWGEPLPQPGTLGNTASCSSDADLWQGVTKPSGARYDVAADTWSAISPGPTHVRLGPSVFDGGSEMLVWGGRLDDCISERNDGLAYDYASDSWRELPPGPFKDRVNATAVWTGQELIIWGGGTQPRGEWNSEPANDGAAFDPHAE